LLLIHEEGKYPKDGSGPGAISLEGTHGLNQTEGSTTKPTLEQNQPNTRETGSRTGLGTGSRTALEPISPAIQARVESVFMDPLTPPPWKHQSLHPLDQILFNLNIGVQTRSKHKNFCAFYAFLSNIDPKNVNEAISDSD